MPTATLLLTSSHAAAGSRRRSIHVTVAAAGKMRSETLARDSGVLTGESNGVGTQGARRGDHLRKPWIRYRRSSGSGETRNLQPPARGAPHATFGRNGTQTDKFLAFFPGQPSSLKRITAGVFVRGDAASRGTSFALHFFVGGPGSKPSAVSTALRIREEPSFPAFFPSPTIAKGNPCRPSIPENARRFFSAVPAPAARTKAVFVAVSASRSSMARGARRENVPFAPFSLWPQAAFRIPRGPQSPTSAHSGVGVGEANIRVRT